MEHIVADILPVILFIFKVGTGIIRDPAFPEGQLQIPVLQLVQVHPAHVQNPLCPFQDRGGENLAHRDIDVCHTVFEDRLFFRILQSMQLHSDIRLVLPFSQYMDVLSLIQSVDHPLLYSLIKLGIQGIDPDDFIKDLRILLSDLRNRKRDHREAPFLPLDILVCDLPGSAVICQG